MPESHLRPQPKRVTACRIACARGLCFSLFLASVGVSLAQSNWVDGTAYGSNDLSIAGSIESVANGPGSLIIGYPDTTALSLDHAVQGFIVVTNTAENFSITASTNATITSSAGAAVTAVNAANLTITGGHFAGTTGQSGGDYPPISGVKTTSAVGGLLRGSSASLNGSDFTGADGRPALVVDASEVVISGGVYNGGGGATGGPGLLAISNSTVTINSGSFTGRVGNTAFYLQDSDTTVHSGTFTGNVGGGDSVVYGDGLFSKITAAATNTVALHGGTFSSLAFWGVEGAVYEVLAGTNLVVMNGIIQSNGTVLVDNQGNAALQEITILDGLMQIQNDFSLAADGGLNLLSADARLRFSGDLELGSGASLSNGLGRTVVNGTFTQAGGSILSFVIGPETNGMLSADTAVFQSNAVLRIDATRAGFSAGTTNVALISTVSGVSGTNDLVIETETTGRVLFNGLSLIDGSDLAAGFTGQALRDYWNADGPLAVLADELDEIGSEELFTAIDSYEDPEQSGEAIEQTYFTAFNNIQVALQGMRAAVGQSISRGSEFREQLKLIPPGAQGPERNNRLRGWTKYYGHYNTHDMEGAHPEYDVTLHGGSVGVDTSIGNLLVGISGGSSRYRITHDANARSDTVAYHGNIYGTYGMEQGYLDAGIFYGENRVDTRTADPFRLEGSFDSDVTGGYLGAGYHLVDLAGETVFTPEASVQYAMYEQDAYAETGSAAVPRAIEAYDADSILSSLGMNVSMLNAKEEDTFRYQADLRLHWMHEFNPDPSDMTFMLQGGSTAYPLALPSLDEDIFRVGIGCSFFNSLPGQPRNVIFRIDFDEWFGDGFNSHNLSVKVAYAF